MKRVCWFKCLWLSIHENNPPHFLNLFYQILHQNYIIVWIQEKQTCLKCCNLNELHLTPSESAHLLLQEFSIFNHTMLNYVTFILWVFSLTETQSIWSSLCDTAGNTDYRPNLFLFVSMSHHTVQHQCDESVLFSYQGDLSSFCVKIIFWYRKFLTLWSWLVPVKSCSV